MMVKTGKADNYSLIFLTVAALALIVMGVISRGMTVVAFLFICTCILFIKDDTKIWCMMVFLMPFATIFKMSAPSSSLFTYAQIVLIARMLFKKKLSKTFLVIYIIYAIYVIIGMGEAYSTCIKQLCMPLIFCCFIGVVDSDNQPEKYARYFIWGIILASVLGYFKEYVPNLTNYVTFKVDKMLEGAERFSALWGDPNYYSVNLILALVLNMYFYANNKFKMDEFWLYFVIIALFGAMTASKSFFLMLAICVVVIIIMLLANKRYLGATVVLVFICIGASLVLTHTNIFENTILRFQEAENFNDLTTNRAGVWERYMGNLSTFELMFGNGIGKGFVNGVPHNTYIDYLYTYGIFGTVIFILSLLASGIYKKSSGKVSQYIPLIVIMIMYFFLSMIFYLDFIWQIALAAIIVRNSKEII